MEVESSKERISSYYYCQQIGNATFKFGISFCASLEIILNSFQNSFIINVHRLFQYYISSLKWFYFELSRNNTFGYLLTTKYTTTVRSVVPREIDYFVIPKCSDTSMLLKKMPEIFQGISFPFQRSTLNRLLCNAGHITCSSPKGKCRYMHVWFLPPWHYGWKISVKQARLGFFRIRQTWVLLLRKHVFPWGKWSLSFFLTEN